MEAQDVGGALNELRLILLQECEDNKFRQVGLDAAQFKKVSATILTGTYKDDTLREGFEMAEMRLNPDWEMDSDAFIGLESHYDFEKDEE